MILKILNSGSVGNCYILENDTDALIIEAGVSFKEVKQALGFNLKKVRAALVTHEHLDHAKEVGAIIAAGIKVYASAGTIGATGLTSHRLIPCESMVKFSCGPFTITPFDVRHDCKQPFGFVISHPETGNVLFITDTYYVPYTFPNLNNILVEANYCTEILDKRLNDGKIHPKVRARVISSHMSLVTCKNLLMANNLEAVNNIVLIHLSDGNSDSGKFQREVEELTGKSVFIARKNTQIPFGKTPFS